MNSTFGKLKKIIGVFVRLVILGAAIKYQYVIMLFFSPFFSDAACLLMSVLASGIAINIFNLEKKW